MQELPLEERATDRLRRVCRAWFGGQQLELERLPAGFSGSLPMLVRAGPSAWVVKSFTPATSPTRAAWVHGLMRHLHDAGVEEVPRLLATREGSTLCRVDDGLWEMAAFIPGAATAAPSSTQASAAARVLARIHRQSALLPGRLPRQGLSLAFVERVGRAAALLGDPWARRTTRAAAGRGAAFREAIAARVAAAGSLFGTLGGTRAMRAWAGAIARPVTLQPVLRDVWCDHVLYAPDRPDHVAGVVDFHAAGIDTAAADVARLFGSWRSPAGRLAMPLDARWAEALASYEEVRPLTSGERRLVPVLHAMGVVFGLDNWFRWSLDEHREFPDRARALARIDGLIDELPAAIAFLDEHQGDRV